MRVRLRFLLMGLVCSAALSVPLWAHAPSGAIFTTVADGTEVNFNIYPTKESVYLDGGPGPGAPQTAAGLDDGRYVFQVTNPNGKTLLSTDKAKCRQFDVANGIITNVVVTGCQHVTGLDVDHGAVTVRLFPYNDTPNPGGVYKVWVTFIEDFALGCSKLGVSTLAAALDRVNCGFNAANAHGFIPSHSKTDNFKVKSGAVQEIDTRFFDDANGNNYPDEGEPWIDGMQIEWTDTVGASNMKSSYLNAALNVNHEAHIEAVEDGIHRISIPDQPGCTVGFIYVDGVRQPEPGAQDVVVQAPKTNKPYTIFIDVQCVP